ncbi:RagB/SusD family nutrient uptake outer membrane protein [Bacteroides graminisolvens]|uniref:RagB/SusD family nutrient uptake outer membrane protein n=1 Tax=Bacteroides graminisolvens TaxID=477666 RepID=UPI0029C79980|nr:RagB/SusD family nutrient uptake outer membrane protein [Bacteroides graminisolvens]
MRYNKIFMAFFAALFISSCSGDFLDKEPTQNASEEQVQELLKNDPTKIQAYITGYYRNLFDPESGASHDDFGLKAIELATDLMGSDMAYYNSHFFVYDYNWDNRGSGYRRPTQTWQQLYAVISGANTVISSLKPKEGESISTEIEYMLGQSYTVRAYAYFWLVNMFQQPYQWNKDKLGIPLYTEDQTRLERCSVSDVYAQILSDIDKGYNYLKGKGIAKKSELNEFAAAAIYANVLAFVSDEPNQWQKVAQYAELAIAGGTLMNSTELLSGLNNINLSEVLWGADIDSESNTFYASFMSHMDPYSPGYGGDLGNYKMIASDLYDKISDTDIRKKWFGVDLAESNALYKYSAYVQKKFIDVGSQGGDVFSSDYIYLRTGEMYFLEAEALFMAGDESGAKAKLSSIMLTRDPQYSVTVSGDALLDEIKLQKRIEMWGEGRRLLDMKRRAEPLDRTQGINHRPTVLKTAGANDYRMIYLIPDKELNANSEITEQNP